MVLKGTVINTAAEEFFPSPLVFSWEQIMGLENLLLNPTPSLGMGLPG